LVYYKIWQKLQKNVLQQFAIHTCQNLSLAKTFLRAADSFAKSRVRHSVFLRAFLGSRRRPHCGITRDLLLLAELRQTDGALRQQLLRLRLLLALRGRRRAARRRGRVHQLRQRLQRLLLRPLAGSGGSGVLRVVVCCARAGGLLRVVVVVVVTAAAAAAAAARVARGGRRGAASTTVCCSGGGAVSTLSPRRDAVCPRQITKGLESLPTVTAGPIFCGLIRPCLVPKYFAKSTL